MPRPPLSDAAVALAAAVISSSVAFWTWRGDLTSSVPSYLITHAIAFAAYSAIAARGRGISPRAVTFALAAALAWRVALVFAPPVLSDDIYRYVWEGRIQLHGGNPYEWEHRPEMPRWTPLRDEVWGRLTHRYYTALYPPLWQLAARAVVAVHDSVRAMKVFVTLCEIAALFALWHVLRRRGLPQSRLLIWAWSPLALVEIAGSGHNDAFALMFVAFSFLALEKGHPLWAAILGGLGAQAKLIPAGIAAAWLRRFRWWHILAAASVFAAVALPYRDAGAGLWHSLTRYAHFWRFNETVFGVLVLALDHNRSATALSAALLAAVIAVVAWRRPEPAVAGLVVIVAWLLLAGNVLPWYALWLLPFLVVRDEPGALLFTGTVALAYLVYPQWRAGGVWQVGWHVRAVEYGPPLLLALWGWRRRRAA